MATPSVLLVRALRQTAARLRAGAEYQWGHFGACNCGHLAQTITRRTKADIHRRAHLQRAFDWGDEAQQYASHELCGTTGLPFDEVLSELVAAGLTTEDLQALEDLNGSAVLARLPPERQELRRHEREDAILYLETWAALLEEQLFLERAKASDESRAPAPDAAGRAVA